MPGVTGRLSPLPPVELAPPPPLPSPPIRLLRPVPLLAAAVMLRRRRTGDNAAAAAAPSSPPSVRKVVASPLALVRAPLLPTIALALLLRE